MSSDPTSQCRRPWIQHGISLLQWLNFFLFCFSFLSAGYFVVLENRCSRGRIGPLGPRRCYPSASDICNTTIASTPSNGVHLRSADLCTYVGGFTPVIPPSNIQHPTSDNNLAGLDATLREHVNLRVHCLIPEFFSKMTVYRYRGIQSRQASTLGQNCILLETPLPGRIPFHF